MHERNAFITLTYDDEHLPEDGGLVLADWQKFAKRARKAMGPFRFFHCGEYGDQFGRPHYHACIFGEDYGADKVDYRTVRDNRLYTSEALSRLWGRGFAVVGDVTFESAAYVARYVMKKITGPKAEEHYERIDKNTGEVRRVKSEYVTMSRRPGIGKEWIDKWMSDVYPRDFVIARGQQMRPPKFYDGQYERIAPGELEKVKVLRKERAAERDEDNTPARLKSKEICQRAKMSLYGRGEF